MSEKQYLMSLIKEGLITSRIYHASKDSNISLEKLSLNRCGTAKTAIIKCGDPFFIKKHIRIIP